VAGAMRREWTLNERRAYTGKQPLDPSDPRGEEIDGQNAGAMGGDLAGLFSAGSEGTEEELGEEAKSAKDEKTLAWVFFDCQCKAAESTWERQVDRGLKKWLAGVKALAQEKLQGVKQRIPPASVQRFDAELAEWMDEVGEPLMRTIVWPLVFTTAEKATRQAAARLGLSFSVFQESILAYAERETAFLVNVMARTTEKAVVEAMTASIQEGLAAGDLIRDLTKRLETDMAFDRTRARLVARTETTRAWNGSQRSSLSDYAKRSGRAVEKGWLSARDDRVRDEHDQLDDGKFYPIDHVYPNLLTEPGEPNCRCTLLYQITDPLTGGQE